MGNLGGKAGQRPVRRSPQSTKEKGGERPEMGDSEMKKEQMQRKELTQSDSSIEKEQLKLTPRFPKKET